MIEVYVVRNNTLGMFYFYVDEKTALDNVLMNDVIDNGYDVEYLGKFKITA